MMPEDQDCLSGLRLGFLAGTLGQGGAERQLYWILKVLREAKAEPVLVCFTEGEYWEGPIRELGIPVIHVSGSRLKRLWRLQGIVKEHQLQAIQSQHFYVNFYAGIVGRYCGVPSIGAIRSNFLSEMEIHGRLLGSIGARITRYLAFNSRSAIAAAVAAGVRADRCHYLPNSLNTENFSPGVNATDRNPDLVLGVGRLGAEKRWDLFLQTIAEARRFRPTLRARIVGDGPLRESLFGLAKEMGIGEAVELAGRCDELAKEYRRAGALLLCSEYEGMPNVVLEAMASELPVIATAVGDVSRIIREGETGFVRGDWNPESVGESLAGLLADGARCEEIGRRARQTIVTEFGGQALLSALTNLYAEALNLGKKGPGF